MESVFTTTRTVLESGCLECCGSPRDVVEILHSEIANLLVVGSLAMLVF